MRDLIVFSEHPDSLEKSIRRSSEGLAEVQLYENVGMQAWVDRYLRKLPGPVSTSCGRQSDDPNQNVVSLWSAHKMSGDTKIDRDLLERLKMQVKKIADSRTPGTNAGDAPEAADTIRTNGRKVLETTRTALNLPGGKNPRGARKT